MRCSTEGVDHLLLDCQVIAKVIERWEGQWFLNLPEQGPQKLRHVLGGAPWAERAAMADLEWQLQQECEAGMAAQMVDTGSQPKPLLSRMALTAVTRNRVVGSCLDCTRHA